MSTSKFRLHPSVPRPSRSVLPPPLSSLGSGSASSSTASAITPRPDDRQVQTRRRPSEYWLNSPAWIDGASDPPIFFYSNEEIYATLCEFRPDHPRLQSHIAEVGSIPDSCAVPSASPTPTSSSSSTPAPPGLPSTENLEDGDAMSGPAPLKQGGHMVTVTMIYSAAEPGKGSRALKPVIKKHRNAKFDYIKVLELNRMEFICEWLRVHDLGDQYSPGVHSGPPFKLSWTGSAGGKSGAITIDSDRDYEVATNALGKKKQDTCQVSVEFDTDLMDGYRIRKRPLPQAEVQDGEVELLYGTKVPCVDGYTEVEQLHGTIILQLKSKWTCEKHQGEHSEPGACYVDSAGNHLGLNNRKLKIWASAIAAADATRHEPPNTLEFDGIRDGRLSTSVKPRGRSGPHHVSTPPTATDPATLLVAAMLPFLTGLASGSVSAPVASNSASTIASNIPTTPVRTKPTPVFSPMPTPASELHVCLADFARIKNIDLTGSEAALAALDLTPDIIPNVPVSRLCDIITAVEGQVYKLQSFCKDWTDRLEEKKHHLL